MTRFRAKGPTAKTILMKHSVVAKIRSMMYIGLYGPYLLTKCPLSNSLSTTKKLILLDPDSYHPTSSHI